MANAYNHLSNIVPKLTQVTRVTENVGDSLVQANLNSYPKVKRGEEENVEYSAQNSTIV